MWWVLREKYYTRKKKKNKSYSQTWTMSGGSVGELYLSKLEKKLLGVGDRIGARSPLEGMVAE